MRRFEETEPRPDFNAIRIKLASPETIRSWSYGEVLKPETINYRTQKPEKEGLFCERIFGPTRDFECNCGKYKRIKYKGVICDRCGVEVTLSKVRRERMGHIELATPVAHVWYYRSIPSKIGLVLDLNLSKLKKVLYYESYIVINSGDSPFKVKELLSEKDYKEASQRYNFVAKTGSESIKDLLSEIDIEELSADLRSRINVETSREMQKKLLTRLKVVEAFRTSRARPEWMILECVPIVPPDLRPLVPLEGGRFATSDLNDLYRRVITRNNRLKNLMEVKAPEIIIKNEKRMLQESVDALLDNSKATHIVKGRGNRPLKSLSDALKGKQGRFRQNLLGKRVDYSARSVIVVGPELKFHQCGIPKIMALELFKPFIIRRLEEKGFVATMKGAKKLLESATPEVWDILEEIVREHPVLLNRAPTLHRLGIQAFEPKLVEEKAIRLHPMVCVPFAADFDGDQMAVHVPLSPEALIETYLLTLSMNNILSPANGLPLTAPTQDIVIGCYYLTKEKKGGRGKGRFFASTEEILHAVEQKVVDLHSTINLSMDGKVISTTPGRVIFNEAVPEELEFVNEVMDKKRLQNLVGSSFRKIGSRRTSEFLDRLKSIGFDYATRAGLTIGIDDMLIPKEKENLVNKTFKQVSEIHKQYRDGAITDTERYNKVIDAWTQVTNEVADILLARLRDDREGFNPVYMMATSGARGNMDQVKQLSGMRGLMSRPQRKIAGRIGEIIESPITSNFREGLTVLEYFISTHGGRKGLADTALKTSDAGYLTRRLVDAAQDVTITCEDCGTILGQETTALKEEEEVIEFLGERLIGKVALEDVVNPLTSEIITKAGEEIDERAVEEIEGAGIGSVKIRSVLTCEARRGLCAKCYGRNLSTGRIAVIGEAVGIIAAQSIGEPGTQLTLRTFHLGGTASRITEESKAAVKSEGNVKFKRVRLCVRKDGARIAVSKNGKIEFSTPKGTVTYNVPYGANIKVDSESKVSKGDVLFEWDPYSMVIIAEQRGKIKYVDIADDVTVREVMDERTGLRQKVIVEHREKTLHPTIIILNKKGERIGDYPIPVGAYILVRDGEAVSPGVLLAKMPREIGKTRDITGGLPRVTELFEARKPKDHAVVTEIDGEVHFGKAVKGTKTVIVVSPTKEERVYQIPYGKHLRVQEGEKVRAGDKLSEGPSNPHDILRIKGATAVQEYLLNEIQSVYRLQNVRIDDKHIGVIVRQMLRRVRIEEPGDTNFIEGDSVDRWVVRKENEEIIAKGGKPATFQPMLLGITKSALTTHSFISATSFQETTRILSEATLAGKKDPLLGLKENVIIGNLIPAGTGLRKYEGIEIEEEEVKKEAV